MAHAVVDHLAERGRGIFMMHALMTQVEYVRNGASNELRLRRALARDDNPAT